MEGSLLNIYKNNFGESFDDIGKAMGTVRSATKLTGKELELATQNAIMLRDSFDWEVDESMKAVRVMMTEFEYSSEEAFTVLAQGRQELGSTADDLLETFNEYSGAFSDLGFNGEEAMNMISNSVESGARNTDVAADAVNEFSTRIKDGSDTTRDALQTAGLNADEIMTKFDKGGEDGREAFQQVTEAIHGIGSASEQEQAAVGLFGTLAEDVGVEAVLALGDIEGQADKTANTLESMSEVKYDTVGEALKGMGKSFQVDVLVPLQDKIMPAVNSGINKVAEWAGVAKDVIGDLFSGDSATDILKKYGLKADNFKPAIDGMKLLQESLSKIRDNAIPVLKQVYQAVKEALINVWPVVKPALISIVSFIGGQVQKITEFWNTNGSQILAAAENAFNGIMTVIQFVMPLVLGIIKSIWGNIQGVINGALNIIMGLVKTFTGLFTGDFSKMWEGVKQLFFGAVEFIWNFVQLTFFGKILGGAKAFILAFRSSFASMWQAVVSLFKGNATSALNHVRAAWSTISSATSKVFTSIWTFLKDTWSSVVTLVRGTVSTLRTVFSAGWKVISTNTTKTFQGVWSFLQSIWNKVIKFIGGVLDSLFNGFSKGFRRIYDTTKSVFNSVWDFLKGIWNTVSDFISGRVSNIFNRVKETWNSVYSTTKSIFKNIYDSVKGRFDDIVSRAKKLPGMIGAGIGNMASKVQGGITKVINAMARTLGKGVNGVIGGVNWVLDKVGVESSVPKWEVPQYAQGTKGHPGGPAMVGDGKGSNAGSELIQTPDGQVSLSPDSNTLMNLPKGTSVLSAKDTREYLESVPAYAWGVGTLKKAWEGTKNVAGKVKDKAVDVWDYVSDPSKLFNKALELFGVETPEMPGAFEGFGKGAFSKAKEGLKGFLKSKVEDFGSIDGNAPGSVKGWISSAISRTGVPSSWLGPLTTIAMKESGGRTGPSTINKWDINWKRGTPSMGLMQTIRPTFDAFKESGWGDIMNPSHNAAAAINYIKSRYGNVFNVPGIKSLAQGLPYEGYADGAFGIDTAQLAWIAEGGWAESVISHDPAKRQSQQAIWRKVGDELGFDYPNSSESGKGGHEFNQYLTFNTADSLNPSEVARKMRQASRRMAEEWRD
nr:phage tail tape measure protein [Halobacillus sp. A5]